jgi:hypothetical protein
MEENKDIVVKVHDSYRWVVAICDKELLGRVLREGKRTLDLSGNFFKGIEMEKKEVLEEIDRCTYEDATFNVVGERSIKIALEAGIIEESGVIKIEGIPFALVLV